MRGLELWEHKKGWRGFSPSQHWDCGVTMGYGMGGSSRGHSALGYRSRSHNQAGSWGTSHPLVPGKEKQALCNTAVQSGDFLNASKFEGWEVSKLSTWKLPVS